MVERTTCARRIDTNHGHDWIEVTARNSFPEVVEIVFSGRDPTVVTVRLSELKDVRAFAKALMDAADSLEEN